MVKCSICSLSFLSLPQFKVHLKIAHKDNLFFKYSCGENLCSRTFDNWKAYRGHLMKAHKCPIKNNTTIPSVKKSFVATSCSTDQDEIDCGSYEDVENSCLEITPHDFKTSYDKSIALLLAKLYKNPSIPRNFVQSFVDDVDTFLTGGFVQILKDKVIQHLTSAKSPQSSIDEVSDMFDTLDEPFRGLDTDYLRMKFFTEGNHYIPPEPYTINNVCFKIFKTRAGPVTKRVKTTGQFIPLRCVFKAFFELPGAVSETLKYVQLLKSSNVNVISNVIQGHLWQCRTSHFSNTDIVIPITFYYDEVESNAALGAHSEKLGAGYIYIPVLPPSCQSKLENILLALLISSDDRKSYEHGRISYNKEVFEPLVKECKFLETEGIQCQTDDLGDVKLYFVLMQVIGDNLGVHGITGYVEGFTANFPCTICRAPKELTKVMTREDPSLLRDPVNYAEDVETSNRSATGVKESCVFNELKSFHIAENFHVDFMHDGPEGICHYVLIPVLKHFVDSKYLTVDILNSRLFYFDLGPSDSSNRPPCIADDFHTMSKIKCTAREMLTLVRILGVLIGDLIPEEDPYWQLYKLHKQIIEICQAKCLNLNVADELDLLVEEHHSLYMKLLKLLLQPKFHFFLHYGRLLKLLGPMSYYASFRGEGKHRHLTRYTRSITSRRNLPMSSAIKHQLSMCFRFIAKEHILPQIESGPGEVMDLVDHCYYHRFRSSLPPNLTSACERVSWVCFQGTRYEPQMVLVIGITDGALFKFGKIVDILISNSSPLFVCAVLNNIGFCDHVGGFEVLPCNIKKLVCVPHEDLLDPFPLYDFSSNSGKRFVILKHYL